MASTPEHVARYVACTLLAASLPPGDDSSAALIASCLTFLEDNEFVTLHRMQDSGKLLHLTDRFTVIKADRVIYYVSHYICWLLH